MHAHLHLSLLVQANEWLAKGGFNVDQHLQTPDPLIWTLLLRWPPDPDLTPIPPPQLRDGSGTAPFLEAPDLVWAERGHGPSLGLGGLLGLRLGLPAGPRGVEVLRGGQHRAGGGGGDGRRRAHGSA